MMNKTFLARLAKVAFVLAATLTLNLLITACSRDYSLPDDKPIEKVATVTIDGVVKQVSDIKMIDNDDNNWEVYLYLSADKQECIWLNYNTDLHGNKLIDLTKKESEHEYQWYWGMAYRDGKNVPFTGSGMPEHYVTFENGQLLINFNKTTKVAEIELKDGKINDNQFGDAKDHTIEINFRDKVNRIESSEDSAH